MKNSIKDKLFNYMFNTLCKERHSDLIRAYRRCNRAKSAAANRQCSENGSEK